MVLDRTWLDREYSPSSAARDASRTLGRYRELGDTARARRQVRERLRYGAAKDEVCHVFPRHTAIASPVLVYVHGGHWQESGIDDACFAAEQSLDAGLAFVAVGYGSAPGRSLTAMVTSVVRALGFLTSEGRHLGIDPQHLHVAGSSAGAHLLAVALTTTGAPPVRSASLMSGLYDLSEIPHTYVNDAIGLTALTASAMSPITMPAPACDEVHLAVGQHETATYLHQQERYAAHLRSLGVRVRADIVSGRDHFDLPLDLSDRTTPFGRSAPYLPRCSDGDAAHREVSYS